MIFELIFFLVFLAVIALSAICWIRLPSLELMVERIKKAEKHLVSFTNKELYSDISPTYFSDRIKNPLWYFWKPVTLHNMLGNELADILTPWMDMKGLEEIYTDKHLLISDPQVAEYYSEIAYQQWMRAGTRRFR